MTDEPIQPPQTADEPADSPAPNHIESYGQPWAPSVANDPAYQSDDVRSDRVEIDLGNGSMRVDYR